MPIPNTPELEALAVEAFRRWKKDEEDTIRDLLGQWVSEIEPEIIYGWPQGLFGGPGIPFIKGIGMAGDPDGRVIMPNKRAPQMVAGAVKRPWPHSGSSGTEKRDIRITY